MNTAQKDPGQFIPMSDQHDQARRHQVKFPRLMDADLKFVAAKELQLLEGLEARLHQKLYDVIEIIRKVANSVPSA